MLVNLNFKSEFLLNVATPKLRITDLVDYAAQGVVDGDTVIGLLEILDPSGAIMYQHAQYNQATPTTGDILPLVSPIVEITLPVDADGNIDQGNYTIRYRSFIDKVIAGSPDGSYIKEKTFNFCVKAPVLAISHKVDCVFAKFTSSDITNYVLAGTIATVLTRSHKIFYPAWREADPVETANATEVISPMPTGTWATKILTTATYEYAEQFFVVLEVSGSVEKEVSCEQTLCDVICQIFALEDQLDDEMQNNPGEAEKTSRRLNTINRYMSEIKVAMDCGETDNIDELLAKIYKTGRFKACGCSAESETVIEGCGATGDPINVTAGAGIMVTQAGDTFNVKIDPTLKTKIDAMKIMAFGTNTPDSVTITPTTVGNTTTVIIDVSALGAGTIITTSIADGAVTTPKIAANAVTGAKITDGTITTTKYADVSVTEEKIGNGAVTANKIENGAVSETKIADGAIIEAKIFNGSVTENKIGASAVTTSKVADNAITSAKIVDGAVVAAKIGDGAVTTPKITDGAVTALKLADGSVIAGKIADGSIATAKYGAGSVTDTVLANNAVINTKIANGAVDANKLAANAVTDTKINAAAVTTTKVADGNITTAKMSGDMKTEIIILEISFENAETGSFDYYFPFAVTLVNIKGVVTKAIAGTDDAGITFANSVGAMNVPGVVFPAASALGYQSILYAAGTNNTIAAGSYIRITPAKTTPGGKVKITLNLLRS